MYKDFYNKCFQVAYGEQQLLKFYNIREIILLNLYNILPFVDKISNSIFKNKNYFEKIEQFSHVYYWHLNSIKKQNKDFLDEIKKNKNSLIFFQSILPHPPIIYNYRKNSYFNNFLEVENYIDSMKIDYNYMAYNYENFYAVDLLLKNLIKTLKEKKQFESSTIIIHGDTGLSEKIKDLDDNKLSGSTLIFIKNKFQNKKKIYDDPIDPSKLFDLIKDKL